MIETNPYAGWHSATTIGVRAVEDVSGISLHAIRHTGLVVGSDETMAQTLWAALMIPTPRTLLNPRARLAVDHAVGITDRSGARFKTIRMLDRVFKNRHVATKVDSLKPGIGCGGTVAQWRITGYWNDDALPAAPGTWILHKVENGESVEIKHHRTRDASDGARLVARDLAIAGSLPTPNEYDLFEDGGMWVYACSDLTRVAPFYTLTFKADAPA